MITRHHDDDDDDDVLNTRGEGDVMSQFGALPTTIQIQIQIQKLLLSVDPFLAGNCRPAVT